MSRRDTLKALGLCWAPAVLLGGASRADAAGLPPIAPAGAWALQSLLPPSSPEPIKFPRRPLKQNFAVLLMRSGYDAVDALDFIPKDKFEAKFWKLRQSELEGYNLLYAPLKMRAGDLTDPLYFDFISFSQAATISREMLQPLRAFSEYVEICPPGIGEDEPCEAGSQLVERPAAFSDDQQLPTYFFQATGDLIYTGLWKGFRGEQFGGPPPAPAGASLQQLADGVSQLMAIMVRQGYALKSSVSDVQPSSSGSGGGSFRVSITGNCNLWSMQALAARRAAVVNLYDAMVIDAFLRASGRQASSFELQTSESGVEEVWTVA